MPSELAVKALTLAFEARHALSVSSRSTTD